MFMQSQSTLEKLGVICFDEMDIRRFYEFDTREKVVYGPNKKLQMAIVRGLTHPWKQPIYFDFDKKMTKDLLFDIIRHSESCGIKVIGVTFDLGNPTIIKELALSPTNFSFRNPVDPTREVFVFLDAPHLLKLIRNHLVDEGMEFELNNEKFVVCQKDFEDILALDSGELKLTKGKLREEHVHCKKSTRQRVRLAAQLLSQTTSRAMTFLFGEPKAKQAKAVQLINDWFDVMNSSHTYSQKKLSCGFRIHLEDQEKALSDMENLFQSSKVIGRKSKLPFQNGVLISIRSTRALFRHLVNTEPDFKYLLLSHVNQDVIENKFSRIRGIGGDNTHPGPVQAIQRIRILMLGRDPDLFISNPSVCLLNKNIEDEVNQGDDATVVTPEVSTDVTAEVSTDISGPRSDELDDILQELGGVEPGDTP
jgi:hypothetical protein